jgi:hypothetical protein
MWFRSEKKIDVAALQQSALAILVHAGTLRECEHHKGSYIQGTCDLAAAYTLANAQFTKGTFGPELVDKHRRSGGRYPPLPAPMT